MLSSKVQQCPRYSHTARFNKWVQLVVRVRSQCGLGRARRRDGCANQNRASSTRYGGESGTSTMRPSSFLVGTGASEPIQITSS